LPSDRVPYNLGVARPRKLTPLANRPALLDLAGQAKESGSALGTSSTRQALHMAVKYSTKGSRQTSRFAILLFLFLIRELKKMFNRFCYPFFDFLTYSIN
jgi:hypothetical protein